MKTTLIALLISANVALANNGIYLEQQGSTGTFDITQIGAANELGTSAEFSKIDGDENIFRIAQIGNNNSVNIDWTGSSTFFDMYMEGDNNVARYDIIGNQNQIFTFIAGGGNKLNISKDNTSDEQGDISQSVVNSYIVGYNNDVSYYLNENIQAIANLNLQGSGNLFTAIQEGGNLGIGHAQFVDVQGDGNNIQIAQSGAEGQVLELIHYGNDTTFRITQSDGTYSGGLEGTGTINSFNGSYIQSPATHTSP